MCASSIYNFFKDYWTDWWTRRNMGKAHNLESIYYDINDVDSDVKYLDKQDVLEDNKV